MKISHYKFHLIWFVIFILFYPLDIFSQKINPVLAKNDSLKIPKTDTLNSAIKYENKTWLIKKIDINGLIAEEVVDYVNLLPDIFALDFGSIGQFSPLAFRGATPQEGKILVGGLTWEEPINGFMNTTNIPINLIEGISYKGAGAFLPYGVQSISGVIQIDTYRFRSSRPYSKIHFRAGDWGYSDLGITFGLPVNQSTHFVISGNRQEYNGFQLNRKHGASRIQTSISHQPNDHFALNYTAYLNKDDVEIPAPLQPDLVPLVAGAKRNENRFDQVLSMKIGNLSRQNKQIQGRIYLSKIRQQTLGDSLLFNNRITAAGAGVQYEMVKGNHWLSAGGRLRLDFLKSEELGNQADQFGYVFVRDGFQISKKIELGIQARLEKHDGYAAAFTPSAHLDLKLSSKSKVWFGLQRAKRYPSFSERYWPTMFFQGNPELIAEQGTVLEGGINFNNEKNIQFQSSMFTNRVQDWIGDTYLDTSRTFYGPVNLGIRTISGLELKFNWKFQKTGQLGLIGSFLHNRQSESAKKLLVPEYSLYSYFEYGRNFFQNYVFIKLRLIGRVFGLRHGTVFEREENILKMGNRSADAIFDGKVTFKFKDAQLTISMENIFNQQYEIVPGFYMPLRTLRFGVEWEFWD